MSLRMTEAQAAIMLGKFYKKPGKAKGTKTKATPKAPSGGELMLEQHLRAARIPFSREFQFHEKRKWRSDFRIIDTKILCEVEGGIWSGGRHTRGTGYENDAEKYSVAASEGWIVLRFTTRQIKNGKALELIKKTIEKNTP